MGLGTLKQSFSLLRPFLSSVRRLCNNSYLKEEFLTDTASDEIWRNATEDGLMNMACGLHQDGDTKQALTLIKCLCDEIPVRKFLLRYTDVAPTTECMSYRFACFHPNMALKLYHDMLEERIRPNAYTYGVMVRGLAMYKGKVGEAKKFLLEMMKNQMKPNAATCVAVVEGLAREGMVEEGVQMVAWMKEKKFWPEEKALRKALKDKSAPEVENVQNILNSK